MKALVLRDPPTFLYVTEHAKQRALERFGVELPEPVWADIGARVQSGTLRSLSVSIRGQSETRTVVVPVTVPDHGPDEICVVLKRRKRDDRPDTLHVITIYWTKVNDS